MTVAEAGQSNSIFTLALELLAHPNVDVHVASFPVLRKRAEELSGSARVAERKHPDSTFTFQEISGLSLQEAFELKGLPEATWPHPPLARTREGLDTLIVVDAFFNAACEACWSLNEKYIISCPMAPLDVARNLQPKWKLLFYYPV